MKKTSAIDLIYLSFLSLVPSLLLAELAFSQEVEPVNFLPNPYETVRNWGELPD